MLKEMFQSAMSAAQLTLNGATDVINDINMTEGARYVSHEDTIWHAGGGRMPGVGIRSAGLIERASNISKLTSRTAILYHNKLLARSQ